MMYLCSTLKKRTEVIGKLERKCVDTGMGVERTIAMLLGKKSVYDTEFFIPVIKIIEELTGKTYSENED